MLLGGLWHGLTWTFAIWGLLHGTALAATRGFMAWRGRGKGPVSPWRHALAVFGTYQFVCLTWIFFRAGSLPNALDILGRIASLSVSFENVTALFAAAMLLAAGTFFLPKQWHARAMESFAGCPFYVHAGALAAVAIALRYLGASGSAAFVYSRF